jgi:hypothetical protein
MTKPSLELVDNELQHTNIEVEHLKQQVEDLIKWKANCTKWAMWWAGVCAAIMAIVTLIQSYWDKFVQLVTLLGGVK